MTRGDNYFEREVDEIKARDLEAERAEKQRVIAVQEAIRAAKETQERLDELNKQRLRDYVGTDPVQLWGPEAASLCREFIEFAGRRSVDNVKLRGAVDLRGPDNVEIYQREVAYGIFRPKVRYEPTRRWIGPGWRSSGYPIAYYRPELRCILETKYETRVKPYRPAEPKPDILLCADGLVRCLKGAPLDIIDLSGRTVIPKFGSWATQFAISEGSGSETDFNGCGGSYTYYRVLSGRRFSEVDPVEGLKSVLTRYAVSIQSRAESG